MRKIFIIILLPVVLQAAPLHIPKSSLETVRQDLSTQLATAQKNKNQKETIRLQAELNKIEGKIKKFRREWTGYRKRQLQIHPQNDKTASEIRELDAYLEANA